MTPKEQLFHKSYIMYEERKGSNHHVPVIVPDDTVAALHKLSDPVCWLDCGIAEDLSWIQVYTYMCVTYTSAAVHKVVYVKVSQIASMSKYVSIKPFLIAYITLIFMLII